MADIYGAIFLLQFILFIVLSGVMLWNILNLAEWYGWKVGIVVFIAFCLNYLVAFVVRILKYEDLLYGQLFRLQIPIFVIGSMFFIIQLIIWISKALPQEVKSHNSIKARGLNGR